MPNTRFEYRYDDTSTQRLVVKVFDLTDPRVIHALSWIAKVIRAAAYDVAPRVAVYQDLPDSAGIPGTVLTREGSVRFDVPGATDHDDLFRDGKIEFDLRQCVEDPRRAARALILIGNLSIVDVPIYEWPTGGGTTPVKPDWEQPGARIGAPIASAPSWFLYRYDGGSIGDRWTGASGQRYELGWFAGASPFARFLGWKAIS